jgi:hypothetical protein
MRLEIVDTLTASHDEHGMRRELYVFDFNISWGFRLIEYWQQSRIDTRHKWVGPRWNVYDERRSKLKQPTIIPDHVLVDARSAVNKEVYKLPVKIGRF